MKNRFALLVSLFMIIQWVSTTNGQEISVISCEAEVRSVGGDIKINGFPFWHVDRVEGKSSMVGRIGHLVRQGTNAVEMSLSAANGIEEDTTGATGVGFSLEITNTTLSNNAIVSEKNLLSAKGFEMATNYYFVVSEHQVKNQPWLLPPTDLTVADKRSINSVVKSLHVALLEQDIPALKKIFRYKNEFCAMSAGISLAEVEDEQASFFTNIFSGKTYFVQPLDSSSLTYTVDSRINLVGVTGAGNSIPIAISLGDDTTFKMPLMFSKTTNNVWVIVQ